MKFLKWLSALLIIILLGLVFMKFGEINHQLVQLNYTTTKAVEMDLAKLVMLAVSVGLLIGIILMFLNIIFTELKNAKE